MKKILIIASILQFSILSFGQFGYGLTASTNIYDRYTNPKDAGDAYRSAGAFFPNIGVGPKIWMGGQNMSLSLEAQAGLSVFALALKDYKGMGAVQFPILAKLNFNGLSGLDKEGKLGFTIGGGIQFTRTELYGLRESFELAGTKRTLFPTYIAQVGYGFGLSGFCLNAFGRFGYNPDTKANNLSVGIQYDFNFNLLKKIATPASSL
jgi:hypothetical protein